MSSAAREHQFLWSGALRRQIEWRAAAAAARYSRGGGAPSREALAAIANENGHIMKERFFCSASSSGEEHAHLLGDWAAWPNRTHVQPSLNAGHVLQPRFASTLVCVANTDTASALRVIAELNPDEMPAALNFANAYSVGGGYLRGARAQEEELCRLAPPLFSSLKRLRYPIRPEEAHYSHTALCRAAGSYELTAPVRVAVISAAMPNLGSPHESLRPGTNDWRRATEMRIGAVLNAARREGHTQLVLGAFGCGAFHNPPVDVARAFALQLRSAEFAGAFEAVAFAILDVRERDEGNLAIFERVLFEELCNGQTLQDSGAGN